MIGDKLFVGTDFHEIICKEKAHLELLIRYLGRNGMDPYAAMKKVNEKVGETVCEPHAGVLASYESLETERSLIVKGMEHIPTFITPIKVLYRDGYRGYTYRTRRIVRPGDMSPR